MASDLSSYKVAFQEKPAVSSKFNNFVQKQQDTNNAVGDTTLMAWASGQIIDLTQLKPGTATTGQVAQWNGSAWVPATLSTISHNKTTAKTVNNTVTETDLFNGEISFSANELASGNVAYVTAWGDYLQNSGADRAAPRWKLVLGGVTVIDTNVIANAVGAGTTRMAWTLRAEIACQGANSVVSSELVGHWQAGAGASGAIFTTGTGTYRVESTGVMAARGNTTAAVDFTTSKALTFTVTLPVANASLEAKLFGAQVRVE